MKLFTLCDVAPWSHEALREIDQAILGEGGAPISLEWESFSLRKDDGVHFTLTGLRSFSKALLDALLDALPPSSSSSPHLPLHILTDSTLAHHSAHTQRTLKRWLSRRLGRRVTLDAVCGTGFVAGAEENQHFWARLRRNRPRGEHHLLVMGGWNDVHNRDGRHAPRAAARVFSHHSDV
jgi:hypothetical protein